jgi:hypothetical protein
LGNIIHFDFSALRLAKLGAVVSSEIGALTHLTSLRLEVSHRFQDSVGAMPTELGRLTRLRSLVLSGTRFLGRIPSELSRLTALTECRLTVGLHVPQFCCNFCYFFIIAFVDW